MKAFRVSIIALVAGLGSTINTEAATRTAANCSLAAVTTAIGAASPGDTVVIPAGTCTWTTQLNISKGITLLGAGMDATILIDNVPKVDNTSSSLMAIRVDSPAGFRVSGMTVRGQAVDNGPNVGHLNAMGSTKAFRFDHLKFDPMTSNAITVDGDMWGVIDHSIFQKVYENAIIIRHSAWQGIGWYGDNSWATPDTYGTQQAVFIEDNEFHENATCGPSCEAYIDDCGRGGRFVARYNTIFDDGFQNHGTETSGRERGCRQMEVYNNTFVANVNRSEVGRIRSGTALIFNNAISGQFDHGVTIDNLRAFNYYDPWGKCDGSGPWDQPGGARCIDMPGTGQGILLSGDSPTPRQWVNNAIDPVYQWNNTAGMAVMGSDSAQVQGGREFYNDTQKPGYAPYTYPHPLVSGSGGGVPTAPTNLRIVSGS